MLHVEQPKILQYAADYKVQLVAAYNLSDAELSKFQSNLKEVFSFIKYEKDKEKIMELIQDEAFTSLDKDAAEVINTCTRLKLNLEEHEQEGCVNMCQAIEEIIQDRVEEERQAMASKLLKDALYPIHKIAELTGLSEQEVENLKLTLA
jgi:GTPase involved in cell partitioning and DNA repair